MISLFWKATSDGISPFVFKIQDHYILIKYWLSVYFNYSISPQGGTIGHTLSRKPILK